MSATRITLKPALLARRISYEVTVRDVTQYAADGSENWRVAYSDLISLNYVTQRIAQTRTRRLDLVTAAARRSIAINLSYRGKRDAPDHAAIRKLHSEVADAIYAARPDLQVVFGIQGRSRLTMFVIAVLILVGGLGLGGAILMSGTDADTLVEVAVPLVAMIGMGLYFGYTNMPWRARPTIPIETFAVLMAADAEDADAQS